MIPEVWEIVDYFKKKRCEKKGWGTFGDLIECGGEYHCLVWIRSLYPSTFKRVTENTHKYTFKEGANYRTLNVSYTAWICVRTQFESLMRIMEEDPEILKKNALYDLSHVYENGVCEKINQTSSPVFKDFERFLTEELGITLMPIMLVT